MVLLKFSARLASQCASESPKALYKFLIKQCRKLPTGPREHYQFQIKQSFKQHMNETDPDRIREIINRSYEDAKFVMTKVC